MLINALCDYYRELEKQGKVVPEGYSRQSVHYLISLMPEGKIDGIIDWQISENVLQKNGKVKEVPRPRSILLPLRTEKPGKTAGFGFFPARKEKRRLCRRRRH